MHILCWVYIVFHTIIIYVYIVFNTFPLAVHAPDSARKCSTLILNYIQLAKVINPILFLMCVNAFFILLHTCKLLVQNMHLISGKIIITSCRMTYKDAVASIHTLSSIPYPEKKNTYYTQVMFNVKYFKKIYVYL